MEKSNKKAGFTKVPNQMLEAVARLRLSGTQFNLLIVVWRYTYGFHKSGHELSLSFLANATGYDERNIQKALKELQKRNIIYQEIHKSKSRNISFNEDVLQWLDKDCNSKVFNETDEIDNGDTDYSQKSVESIGKMDKAAYGGFTKQEINKKNTKEIDIFFESIWKLLPNPLGKSKVSWDQKVMLYEEVGYIRLKQAIERYSSVVEGCEMKYVQHGSNFLNGGYKDYLQPEIDQQVQERPVIIRRIDSSHNIEMADDKLKQQIM